MLRGNSGHERAALVALLVGAWWAAPLVEIITHGDTPNTEDEAKKLEEEEGDDDELEDDVRGNETMDGHYHDDQDELADDGDYYLDSRADERGFGRTPTGATATGVHGDGGEGLGWRRRHARCPACDATSAALDVHVVGGFVRGEAPCPGRGGRCSGAPEVRAEFLRRISALYANAGRAKLLQSSTPGTHRHLALLLGGARGVPLELALDISTAFDETWGGWSREQRLNGASCR